MHLFTGNPSHKKAHIDNKLPDWLRTRLSLPPQK